jgi:alkanesulfonate monooxygenase SsuD/methylene tetrahydromethanopterin reductase-like flavin-dependent oxidoreductase (luciferase family)
MFFTEYSMTAPELAVALEERGYDSVWAPEHSHIPASRKTPFPGGGDLPKQYADAMEAAMGKVGVDGAIYIKYKPSSPTRRRRSPSSAVARGILLNSSTYLTACLSWWSTWTP